MEDSMRKTSEKGRKLLRKFFIFLGVAAISLVFQACYGPSIPDYDLDENPNTENTSSDK